MTAGEWDGCSDPQRMLAALLRARAGDRKFRLFACACCRHIWDRLPAPENQHLAVAVEDHPDGTFEDPDLHAACVASSAREGEFRGQQVYWAAKDLGRGFYKMTAGLSAAAVVLRAQAAAGRSEAAAQADLLRDVFGTAANGVPFDPAWRSEAAVLLARGMYESRDFSPMPILGDALQDAGCEDGGVLGHCRGAGPHVRGCWVVDLVLGRA